MLAPGRYVDVAKIAPPRAELAAFVAAADREMPFGVETAPLRRLPGTGKGARGRAGRLRRAAMISPRSGSDLRLRSVSMRRVGLAWGSRCASH
jgi:hypothetical protein